MATLQTLQDYLASMIREPYAQANKWTVPERLTWLNEGIKQTAMLTKCNTADDSIDTVSGTQAYTLNSTNLTYAAYDIDEERGIIYTASGSNPVRLNRKFQSELDRSSGDEDWYITTGASTSYMFNTRTKNLDVVPFPATSTNTGLKINYVYLPDDLENLTDTVDLPPELVYAPSCWAAWKLWEKRGKHAQAQNFKKEFYEQIRFDKVSDALGADSDFCMIGYTDDYGDKTDNYGDQR